MARINRESLNICIKYLYVNAYFFQSIFTFQWNDMEEIIFRNAERA